jgi:hypothetical protein
MATKPLVCVVSILQRKSLACFPVFAQRKGKEEVFIAIGRTEHHEDQMALVGRYSRGPFWGGFFERASSYFISHSPNGLSSYSNFLFQPWAPPIK